MSRARTEEKQAELIRQLLQTVKDPELPMLDIVELGIFREAEVTPEGVKVRLTPTYTGCPALRVIEEQVQHTLKEAGYQKVQVEWVFAPAWSTDWIAPSARQKMKEFGIAPPQPACGGTKVANVKLLFQEVDEGIPCPYCGSNRTRQTSAFGPTACKALWVCQECKQPFEYFKSL